MERDNLVLAEVTAREIGRVRSLATPKDHASALAILRKVARQS